MVFLICICNVFNWFNLKQDYEKPHAQKNILQFRGMISRDLAVKGSNIFQHLRLYLCSETLVNDKNTKKCHLLCTSQKKRKITILEIIKYFPGRTQCETLQYCDTFRLSALQHSESWTKMLLLIQLPRQYSKSFKKDDFWTKQIDRF